jgi:hypothetical protein
MLPTAHAAHHPWSSARPALHASSSSKDHLDLVQRVQHVELGEVEVREAVDG